MDDFDAFMQRMSDQALTTSDADMLGIDRMRLWSERFDTREHRRVLRMHRHQVRDYDKRVKHRQYVRDVEERKLDHFVEKLANMVPPPEPVEMEPVFTDRQLEIAMRSLERHGA
jgi:hypothetical protein